mmetsp:Transcript_22809/g.34563  ORF Transcript_22809/g.34563 Transcript_22809/m.34563 type:complete len:329 (-) Transcript_22809:2000-2986(-)|eukprot:scaffold3511_cov144-Skeletonema_dohrnii-CCMP3373.AAC.20
MAMATRLSSSAVIRSTAAAHISLTVTSLAYSAFGPSSLQSTSNYENKDSSTHHKDQEIMGALPWLDQLHKIIANMYTGGGTKFRAVQSNIMVQMHNDVSLENPLVSYTGVSEIERAFRARLFLHPQNDVQTLLECVHVEASDDSISNGATSATERQRQLQQLGLLSPSLKGISTPIISPPTLKVTYRLQQKYGRLFTVQSMLEVTVQVRRGNARKVRDITPSNLAVPLATSASGHYSRAAAATAAANQPSLTAALSNAASKIAAATTMARGSHSNNNTDLSPGGHPLVVEVVKIEEMWRGVPLLQFMPFHCSRRLNGAMLGLACIIFN